MGNPFSFPPGTNEDTPVFVISVAAQLSGPPAAAGPAW